MAPRIEGIIPVMLTPFTEAGQVDYAGLERLIEWYLANGSDALFAVCQSSEMLFLAWPNGPRSAATWSGRWQDGCRSSSQGISAMTWMPRSRN